MQRGEVDFVVLWFLCMFAPRKLIGDNSKSHGNAWNSCGHLVATFGHAVTLLEASQMQEFRLYILKVIINCVHVTNESHEHQRLS